jgi:hypothetical protein
MLEEDLVVRVAVKNGLRSPQENLKFNFKTHLFRLSKCQLNNLLVLKLYRLWTTHHDLADKAFGEFLLVFVISLG